MTSLGTLALQAQLSTELARIARMFRSPKITLVVRNPDFGANGSADVVIGDDDLDEAIKAIQRFKEIGA